jgi:hypothetical protein
MGQCCAACAVSASIPANAQLDALLGRVSARQARLLPCSRQGPSRQCPRPPKWRHSQPKCGPSCTATAASPRCARLRCPRWRSAAWWFAWRRRASTRSITSCISSPASWRLLCSRARGWRRCVSAALRAAGPAHRSRAPPCVGSLELRACGAASRRLQAALRRCLQDFAGTVAAANPGSAFKVGQRV